MATGKTKNTDFFLCVYKSSFLGWVFDACFIKIGFFLKLCRNIFIVWKSNEKKKCSIYLFIVCFKGKYFIKQYCL